jgi:hypothetical protein
MFEVLGKTKKLLTLNSESNKNILQEWMMIAQPCEYTELHWIIYFCEFYAMWIIVQ